MTVLNLQVGASADDATEKIAALSTGEMSTDFLSVVFGGDFAGWGNGGLRFTGVSGLSGAAISAATLTFVATHTDSGAFIGDWYAHDAAAPGAFTTTNYNITDTGQRPRTTATCEGDSSDFGNWTAGVEYTFTGDGVNTIADIIQELADSYDPSAIALLFIETSGTGERLAKSYDFASGTAPKLDITFTTGGPSIVTGQVDLAGVGSLASIAGVTLPASAALSGVGALAAAGTIGVIHEGAAVLSGVGTLTLGTPVRTLVGQASILGEGSLVAVGERGALAAAVLGGVGTLTVIGEVGIEGRAALAGVGSMSVLAERIVTGQGALAGAGSLVGAGVVTTIGTALLSGVGTLTVIGESGAILYTQMGKRIYEIDPADYPSGALFYLEATMTAEGTDVTAAVRVYNITDAGEVAGSELLIPGPGPTWDRTSTFSLPSGTKRYRLEYGGTAGGIYTPHGAALRVASS